MRIGRSAPPAEDIINITPLVDMMFILVIFFSLTSVFQQEERDIQVNLPETTEDQTLSSASKVIVINVRKDGTYVMGAQRATIQEIGKLLTTALEADPNQKVLVRGDQQALHGHVAAAVVACKRAGVHEANIGYQVAR